MRSHLILTEQAWPTSKDYIWTCQFINHSWPSEVQPMNFQQKARPTVVNCSPTHLQSFKSDRHCGGIMITGATRMNNSPCTCHSFPTKKNFLLKIFTLRSHSDELSPRATPWEPLPEREIVSLKSWQGLIQSQSSPKKNPPSMFWQQSITEDLAKGNQSKDLLSESQAGSSWVWRTLWGVHIDHSQCMLKPPSTCHSWEGSTKPDPRPYPPPNSNLHQRNHSNLYQSPLQIFTREKFHTDFH